MRTPFCSLSRTNNGLRRSYVWNPWDGLPCLGPVGSAVEPLTGPLVRSSRGWPRRIRSGRKRYIFKAEKRSTSVTNERQKDQKRGPEEPPDLEVLQQSAEDELKDPGNFLEYLLPRPLRLTLLGGGVVSCFVASAISASQLARDLSYQLQPDFTTVLVNLGGLAAFVLLFLRDQAAASTRLQRRKEIRDAQLRIGDREIFVNEKGERMSRLKDVDDDWILRRLERWGRKDNMPFIGPKKGALLQSLVRQREPNLAVEVGSMAGYSALTIARALPPRARLIGMESDLLWALAAKRFLWQAGQGELRSQSQQRRQAQVDVWWGKAERLLASKFGNGAKIDFLFLDGLPSEYLTYLKAAEAHLSEGALVVADNAGVFAQGGLKPYLAYVRNSPTYESSFVEVPLEWRDDVPDGFEVSRYKGGAVEM
eukprot:jgi/Botrbrau1/10496/Bobra.0133s0099.2